MYDTFSDVILADITDHYPIFTILQINCSQKRIHIKFWDNSGLNLTRLKLELSSTLS